ncbi:MAG: RlmE family RNA methyltransferase [Nanoarchaeota archaeon]
MKDYYTKKAREEGYPARSAYKLKQVNKKFRIIRNKDRVLDLGCSPGGWSKVALECVGNEGAVIGVDINPPEVSSKNFEYIKLDIYDEKIIEKIHGTFNVVISDASPRTTGQKLFDQEASYWLALRSLEVACKKLNYGGYFICKIFQGPNYNNFLTAVKKKFKYVKTVKPDASKSKSKEMFLVGLRFKG